MVQMKRKIIWFCCYAFFISNICIAQSYDKFQKHSLYTDFKPKNIGDVVTILIVESASGGQQSGANSSDQASLKASGGITGNLTSVLPLLGASSKYERSHTGSMGTSQKDVMMAKITAVVSKISPNGNLTLQGKRRIEVNGDTHILELKGIARLKDITSDNLIYSYNLANVEIAYKKAGLGNKFGKQGWFSRWTTWVMVLGLGASAYLGISATSN